MRSGPTSVSVPRIADRERGTPSRVARAARLRPTVDDEAPQARAPPSGGADCREGDRTPDEIESALGVTIAALFPLSPSSERPRRAAMAGAIALPIVVEPVAETSAMRGSLGEAGQRGRRRRRRCSKSPSGTSPCRSAARASSDVVAIAVRGVRSEGFHTTGSPHTSASAAFQLHTATGKLNALITPTGPSGCHVSVRRCPAAPR